jgi:hypothetical protein
MLLALSLRLDMRSTLFPAEVCSGSESKRGARTMDTNKLKQGSRFSVRQLIRAVAPWIVTVTSAP